MFFGVLRCGVVLLGELGELDLMGLMGLMGVMGLMGGVRKFEFLVF